MDGTNDRPKTLPHKESIMKTVDPRKFFAGYKAAGTHPLYEKAPAPQPKPAPEPKPVIYIATLVLNTSQERQPAGPKKVTP